MRFSEASQVMSVLQLDSRRVQKAHYSRWNESEYLIPLVIFPDEIAASTENASRRQLIQRYQRRVEESETKLEAKEDLQAFLGIDKHSPENQSCKSVF